MPAILGSFYNWLTWLYVVASPHYMYLTFVQHDSLCLILWWCSNSLVVSRQNPHHYFSPWDFHTMVHGSYHVAEACSMDSEIEREIERYA
jgi:hypothetical protein